jgi:serine/threonine protein kinase
MDIDENLVDSKLCGTPLFLSPEVYMKKPYNEKSEIWALGVLLYELLSLDFPFMANSMSELGWKVVNEPNFKPCFVRKATKYRRAHLAFSIRC